MWMASVTSVKSITRNSSRFVLCSNTRTFIYIWHTHAHRYKSLHPTHVAPGLWSTGGRGWGDEGGLQVIKIRCGFVSVSSANPPSDKSEAYHSTAVSHSFCPFSFLSSPPPLLSHTAFHHYFRPRFCSGLSYIQVMIFYCNIQIFCLQVPPHLIPFFSCTFSNRDTNAEIIKCFTSSYEVPYAHKRKYDSSFLKLSAYTLPYLVSLSGKGSIWMWSLLSQEHHAMLCVSVLLSPKALWKKKTRAMTHEANALLEFWGYFLNTFWEKGSMSSVRQCAIFFHS